MAVTDSLTTLDSEDEHQARDDARAKRAQEDDMDVAPVHRGGCYEVDSASGNTYDVGLLDETCTCPDDLNLQTLKPCKHVQRAQIGFDAGQILRPTDGCREVPQGQVPRLRRVVRIAQKWADGRRRIYLN